MQHLSRICLFFCHDSPPPNRFLWSLCLMRTGRAELDVGFAGFVASESGGKHVSVYSDDRIEPKEKDLLTWRRLHQLVRRQFPSHHDCPAIRPPKMRSICRRWFKSCAASKRTNSSTVCRPRTSWTP